MWGFCVKSLFCHAVLCVLSIAGEERAGCFSFLVFLVSYPVPFYLCEKRGHCVYVMCDGVFHPNNYLSSAQIGTVSS